MSAADDALGLAESVFYPPVAFYFTVIIGDISEDAENILDTSFQEASGITTEIETEKVYEGGSQYVQNLPTKIIHPNLVLKRGITTLTSPLATWCKSTLETDFGVPIVPKLVRVFLLNAFATPIMGWSFSNAYPVKWQVEPFNSEANKVAIENIELSYMYSTRLDLTASAMSLLG